MRRVWNASATESPGGPPFEDTINAVPAKFARSRFVVRAPQERIGGSSSACRFAKQRLACARQFPRPKGAEVSPPDLSSFQRCSPAEARHSRTELPPVSRPRSQHAPAIRTPCLSGRHIDSACLESTLRLFHAVQGHEFLNMRVLRLHEAFGGPEVDHAALVQKDDAVGDFVHQIQVVRHDHGGQL